MDKTSAFHLALMSLGRAVYLFQGACPDRTEAAEVR